VIVEVSGEFDRVERFLELLRPYGVTDLARSGPVAMSREVAVHER
jgi:acetolactate synthase small subunit